MEKPNDKLIPAGTDKDLVERIKDISEEYTHEKAEQYLKKLGELRNEGYHITDYLLMYSMVRLGFYRREGEKK